jgi:hypothetical protein
MVTLVKTTCSLITEVQMDVMTSKQHWDHAALVATLESKLEELHHEMESQDTALQADVEAITKAVFNNDGVVGKLSTKLKLMEDKFDKGGIELGSYKFQSWNDFNNWVKS